MNVYTLPNGTVVAIRLCRSGNLIHVATMLIN
jgi:hypothetical protein